MHEHQLSNPEFSLDELKSRFAGSQNTTRSSGIITIPVVFHVIHNGTPIGTAENVADAFIMAQLDQINDDFRRHNSDRQNTPAEFLGVAADMEIEFCLAQQDTAGYPTSGINRYNFGIAQYTPSEFKNIVQRKTTWDRDRYLNIWIADIDPYLGYAYLPGGDPVGDGLTLDYTTVGALYKPNPAGGAYAYGRTATHEIAHWLGLDHHWAVQWDCTADDGVGDTPKQQNYYLGSPSHPQSSCSSMDMFMNFLDYVDDRSMNLYTQGQKNVMRGVLSSVRAGIQGSIACQASTPKVMFRTTSDMAYEGTSSCQLSGKRIKVWMDIAAPPSRTTVVHINSGGSAQLGKDYSLSTYQINFIQGSTQSRSFDIILNEDAYVEGMKDIVLTFTLSANGGNAIKGHTKQTYRLAIINDDSPAQYAGHMDAMVGQHTGSATSVSPFKGSKTDARTEIIYTKSDLLSAGLHEGFITSLSFFVTSKNSYRPFQNFTIKLGLTEKNVFQNYDGFSAGLTEVYRQSISTRTGEMRFPLNNPFWWDGESNLVVQCCFDNSASSADDGIKYENTGSFYHVLSEAQNNDVGCNLDRMPNEYGLRPQMEVELDYGQLVATHININNGYAELPVGPKSTVHLYDQMTGEIMMSIENHTNHDFGCCRIEVDDEGYSAKPLWASTFDRTSKSFSFTPEYPDPTSDLDVSLYYTEDEIWGWEYHNRQSQHRGQLQMMVCDQTVLSSSPADCYAVPISATSFGGDLKYTARLNSSFYGASLSNWYGGFLAVSLLDLNVAFDGDLIQLELHAKDIESRDTIDIYKQMEDGHIDLWKSITSDDSFIKLTDNEFEPGAIILYQARLRSSHQKVQSQWKSVRTMVDQELYYDVQNQTLRHLQKSSEEKHYIVRNALGQTVDRFESSSLPYDLSNWPSGVYFVSKSGLMGTSLLQILKL